MRAIRCSPWTLLIVVILADAAPAPNCGGKHEYDGYLEVGASDCACAPGQISVSVDGSHYRITCSWQNALTLKMPPGDYVVSAASDKDSWAERTCSVQSELTTRIDLGCPSDHVGQCASGAH
jgi:hypothetical protein